MNCPVPSVGAYCDQADGKSVHTFDKSDDRGAWEGGGTIKEHIGV